MTSYLHVYKDSKEHVVTPAGQYYKLAKHHNSGKEWQSQWPVLYRSQSLNRPCHMFMLRFYGPVNPWGYVERDQYLITFILGRLSPQCTFFHQKLTTALLELAKGNDCRKYFIIKSPWKNVANPVRIEPQPPDHQSEVHPLEPPWSVTTPYKNVWAYVDSKGLDQSTNSCSLIWAFPVRYQNHWIL